MMLHEISLKNNRIEAAYFHDFSTLNAFLIVTYWMMSFELSKCRWTWNFPLYLDVRKEKPRNRLLTMLIKLLHTPAWHFQNNKLKESPAVDKSSNMFQPLLVGWMTTKTSSINNNSARNNVIVFKTTKGLQSNVHRWGQPFVSPVVFESGS